MRADRSFRPRIGLSPFPKIAFIVLSAIFTILSVAQIRQLAEFGSLFSVAESLVKGQDAPASLIHARATNVDEIVADDICLTDIVTAGAVVVLADLDRADPDKDYDAWVAAFRRAQTYFEHAVSCSPTNGNYWLRLAMVKQAIAERPEEITRLMSQSIKWAPAENGTLLGRFALWNKVSDATLLSARDLVMRDLHALLTYGDTREVDAAVRSAGLPLHPYIAESARLLSPERIEEFSAIDPDFKKLLKTAAGA